MSAEASTPQPDLPRRRLRVVKSNRSQILLFSILTLILTAANGVGRPGLGAKLRNAGLCRRRSQRA